MRLRCMWVNRVRFPDLQSGHQSFWEATSLEDCLGQMFHEVLVDIKNEAERQKQVPLGFTLEFSFEVYDAYGEAVQCTSPEAVYQAMADQAAFLLAPRGRKVPYNGKR